MTDSIIRVNIEVCIEADNEDIARQYAASHGLPTVRSIWNGKSDAKGGRLYINDKQTITFSTTPSSPEVGTDTCTAICNLMHFPAA